MAEPENPQNPEHRDIPERVRAVDEALARRGVSEATSERVRRAVLRKALAQPFQARLRWWPALAFAAGAAVVGLVVVDTGEAPQQIIEVTGGDLAEPDESAGSIEPSAAPCAALELGRAQLASGECVAFDGVRISVLTPAELERGGAAVELVSGEALFEVDPRPTDPLHVHAGGVDVEVVGTRFVVHQLGELGWISMLEGRVRVDMGDGSVAELGGGQRLEWPGPDRGSGVPEPALGSGRSRREDEDAGEREGATTGEPDEGLAELLAEVAQLRRRGEFEAAVDRLRADEQPGWSRRSRQLVSYEIGSLLERQLRDFDAACAHWSEHRRRYPDGRHDASVARAMDRMGCAQRP